MFCLGPFSLPLCGSLVSMMTVSLTPLSHPYRVMHAMSEVYGRVMRVMLGDQEWIILSGLPEIKQFAMTQQSTFHLESKTFNEMYSFDEPFGKTLLIAHGD